jgi:hypothetical protein
MKKFIRKYWLLLFLATVIGILLAFWVAKSTQKPVGSPPITANPLLIVDRFPKLETFEAANSTTPIFITFNQPINLNSVIATSNPPAEFKLELRPENQSRLVVRPVNPWKENQSFVIIIKAGVTAADGKSRLEKDAEIRFTIKEIPAPVYDQPS